MREKEKEMLQKWKEPQFWALHFCLVWTFTGYNTKMRKLNVKKQYFLIISVLKYLDKTEREREECSPQLRLSSCVSRWLLWNQIIKLIPSVRLWVNFPSTSTSFSPFPAYSPHLQRFTIPITPNNMIQSFCQAVMQYKFVNHIKYNINTLACLPKTKWYYNVSVP